MGEANDTLRVGEVATRLKVNAATVGRWMRHGVVRDGRRVKLGMTWVGGERRTTEGFLAAFLEQLNPGPPAPVVGPRELSRRSKAADRQLRALGVKV